METFDGRYGVAAENEGITKCLHCQHADVVLEQDGEHLVLEATKMRVHDVQWHLHSIEAKLLIGRDF